MCAPAPPFTAASSRAISAAQTMLPTLRGFCISRTNGRPPPLASQIDRKSIQLGKVYPERARSNRGTEKDDDAQHADVHILTPTRGKHGSTWPKGRRDEGRDQFFHLRMIQVYRKLKVDNHVAVLCTYQKWKELAGLAALVPNSLQAARTATESVSVHVRTCCSAQQQTRTAVGTEWSWQLGL